jgi:glycine cleavage system transcriptional repressor
MRHFAVTAIGSDRPGIVAAVSEVLLEHRGNIEDSQMTILCGRFTMMLIVATDEGVDRQRLASELEQVRDDLGLDAISLSEVTEARAKAGPSPSHIVSVYGVDHPGIVHAVSSTLARRRVNITDLTTRLVGGEEGEPLYVMMLEIALPTSVSAEEIEQSLHDVGERQGVELTVRPLEQDAL